MALWESTWTKLCSMSAPCRWLELLGVAAGVAGVGGGELAGRALQRGREEQGLAVGRGLGDDPADRRLEAHVEHPVGLVEDEDADAVERDDAAGEQVLEPAGGGDDDVGAAGGGDLRAEADAAVDGGDAQLPGAGDRARARRRSGWPARGSAPGPGRRAPVAGLDQVDHRDAEGERLAGAGRRLDQQVVAGERVADDHLLDGEGLVMSRAASAPTTGLEMPRSANDMNVVCSFCMRFREIQQPQNAQSARRKRNLSGGGGAKPDSEHRSRPRAAWRRPDRSKAQ